MSWISKILEIHKQFKELEAQTKGNIFRLGAILFLLFFSYPLVRVSTTTLLLEEFGAKGSPYAWGFSVVFLMIAVSLFNRAQKSFSMSQIYRVTVLVTLGFFICFYVFYKFVSPYGAYLLYIAKEVYIVVLVNSVLAHLNTQIEKKTANIIYGPLGAFSSLGGISGAFLTSFLAKYLHQELIFGAAFVFVLATYFIFSSSGDSKSTEETQELKKVSALDSIKSVKSYIFFIAAIVLLSQFVINIANYQFNFFLTDYFNDNSARGEFLGKVYGLINLCSLLIQLFAIPFILKFIPSFFTHLGIASVYAISFLAPLVMGAPTLLSAAGTFIVFKGLDYSIFSAAKELLYFSLSDQQKYGAKYIVDMIVYRFSKGLISVLLILLPLESISWLMAGCLTLWVVLLFPLFKIYKNLNLERENKL